MGLYIVRRLLISLPILFGILIITFLLARSIPGHPCVAILSEKATQATCDRLIKAKGLDKSLPVQFTIYVKDVTRGDFGDSIRFGRPVLQVLVERMPATVELSLMAFTFAVLFGLPIGILSANYKNSPLDTTVQLGTNMGLAMPVFWLGLIIIYVFAVLLKDTPFWLPPSGRLSVGVRSIPFYEAYGMTLTEGTAKYYLLDFLSNFYILNSILTLDFKTLGDALRHLILPAGTLSIIPLAILTRMTRSSLLEELGMNYILAARAKGLRHHTVIGKHGFRNALLPIVTTMGLQIGGLLSGAVLAESIFSFPGVGRMLFESIVLHDYPVAQAIILIVGVMYILVNLIIEASYAFLDPRIQLK